VLKALIPSGTYSVKQVNTVCNDIHKKFKKIQMKPKESWVVVMAAGIMPSEKEVDHDKLAFVLGKALKYIILRKR
jgi:hypothetical protein